MANSRRFCYYGGLFPYIGLHLALTGRVSRPCVPCSLLSLRLRHAADNGAADGARRDVGADVGADSI